MDGWTNSVAAADDIAAGVDPATVPGTPEYTAKQAAAIKVWQDAKASFVSWQTYEREVRAGVVAAYFPDARKGVNNLELSDGRTLKYTRTITYDFGDSSNEKIESVMDAIEKQGNIGPVLVDRLIKTKYELSVTEYNALNTDNADEAAIKRLIDTILTTKDGSPTLAIKEPKA